MDAPEEPCRQPDPGMKARRPQGPFLHFHPNLSQTTALALADPGGLGTHSRGRQRRGTDNKVQAASAWLERLFFKNEQDVTDFKRGAVNDMENIIQSSQRCRGVRAKCAAVSFLASPPRGQDRKGGGAGVSPPDPPPQTPRPPSRLGLFSSSCPYSSTPEGWGFRVFLFFS